jgi:hypothetical protein
MNDARLWILLLPIGLFCLMVAATLAGHRMVLVRSRRADDEAPVGTSAIDAPRCESDPAAARPGGPGACQPTIDSITWPCTSVSRRWMPLL